MTEEEYKARLNQIEENFDKAKNELYKEYAASQRLYGIGDIISDGTNTILIKKLGAYVWAALPSPIYIGPSLRKDLTPKKSGEVQRIYGNERTKLIQKSTQ